MDIIHSISNPILASKTYLIDAGPDCAVIIDPGDPDVSGLIDYLKSRNKKNINVLLTHEHADHCAGLNPLYLYMPFELYGNHVIANRIADKKSNLSMYLGEISAFEVRIPVIMVSDNEIVRICGHEFSFLETPGHSPGGLCILFNDVVFTGDTLLNNTKTPLNMPQSSKKDYFQSIKKLEKYIRSGMTVYPGHGEAFVWDGDWGRYYR